MILLLLLFFWRLLSVLLAIALLPGTIYLLLLTTAGMFRPRVRRNAHLDEVAQDSQGASEKPYRLTILIPAHNEALSIRACLESIHAADSQGVALRVVVVADNCSDTTAELARAAGAEVLVRVNPAKRGKGYALNFAFQSSIASASDGFAIVDADSRISVNFIVETANALKSGADATQCRYVIENETATSRVRLLSLAAAAFNVLRARGRANLGFSAGLYGNGFALSAAVVRRAPYTAYSIVEDVEYHLTLLAAGKRVTFLDSAKVMVSAPASGRASDSQRARWEGGRFRLARTRLVEVLGRVAQGDWSFLEPALDLLLLPLAFHVVLLCPILTSPIGTIQVFGLVAMLVVFLHLAVAAFVAGRGWRDLAALLAAPLYILWKLSLLPKLHQASKKHAPWIRTERAGEIPPHFSEVVKP